MANKTKQNKVFQEAQLNFLICNDKNETIITTKYKKNTWIFSSVH